MIVKSFFVYFVIFPTMAFVSSPNSLNISLEQRVANEDVMILFRTNVSTIEEEITDGDGGDAIGTPSCSNVIGGDGGYGGSAEAGTDVEEGQEGEKGETGYCEIEDPNEG